MSRIDHRSAVGLLVDAVTLGVLVMLVAVLLRPRVPVDGAAPPAADRNLPDSLWRAAWEASHRKGAPDAPVKLLQFSDFECPACRRFAIEMKDIVESSNERIAMGFIHYPLPQHRLARHAAAVSECAGARGEFWAAYDSLLVRRADLGLVSWSRILGNGMTDDELAACVESDAHSAILDRHNSLVVAVEAGGTPTVVLNGKLLARPPTRAELDSIVLASVSTVRR